MQFQNSDWGTANNFEKLNKKKNPDLMMMWNKTQDEPASIYPTSTGRQRLLYILLLVPDYERWRETSREREGKRAKHSLALLYLGSAGQHNSLERKATLSPSTYALNLPWPQNIPWVPWRPTQHPPWTHEPEVPRCRSTGQVRGQGKMATQNGMRTCE